MKCSTAREAMNNLIDGQEDARAEDALEHLKICHQCREWRESVDRMLNILAETHYEMPMMDISAAVMAELPARFPASDGQRQLPGRILVWVAALWLTGLAILAVLGMAVGGWSLSGAISGIGALGRELVGATGYGLSGLVVAARAVAGTAIHLLAGLAVPAARLRGPLALFLVTDTALLLAVYVILRGRRRAAGPFCIIA